MKNKLRILWKTLCYIEEDIWIGLGIFVGLLTAVLLSIFVPIFNFEEKAFSLFYIAQLVWNTIAWIMVVSVACGVICLIGYGCCKLIEGILYVIEDVVDSYREAKREVDDENLQK